MDKRRVLRNEGARDDKDDPRAENDRRRIFLGAIEYTDSAFDRERAASLLDEGESSRLASFSRDSRKDEFLAGRLLAKDMAASLLGVEARDIAIETGAEGKPRLSHGLYLGIAHSRGLALCAILLARGESTEGGLGLDLECISRRIGRGGIAASFFSESERAFVGDDDSRFFVIWTLKEAFVKRSGAGISAIRETPEFSPLSDGSLSARGPDAMAADAEPCDYLCLGLGDRFVAALAIQGSASPLELSLDPRFPLPPELKARKLFSTSPISPL
jgi:phosphopantetheinyl transferase